MDPTPPRRSCASDIETICARARCVVTDAPHVDLVSSAKILLGESTHASLEALDARRIMPRTAAPGTAKM